MTEAADAPKTMTYTVHNPTRANRVIYDANHNPVTIEAGRTKENVTLHVQVANEIKSRPEGTDLVIKRGHDAGLVKAGVPKPARVKLDPNAAAEATEEEKDDDADDESGRIDVEDDDDDADDGEGSDDEDADDAEDDDDADDADADDGADKAAEGQRIEYLVANSTKLEFNDFKEQAKQILGNKYPKKSPTRAAIVKALQKKAKR